MRCTARPYLAAARASSTTPRSPIIDRMAQVSGELVRLAPVDGDRLTFGGAGQAADGRGGGAGHGQFHLAAVRGCAGPRRLRLLWF